VEASAKMQPNVKRDLLLIFASSLTNAKRDLLVKQHLFKTANTQIQDNLALSTGESAKQCLGNKSNGEHYLISTN